ncbi:capZ-interacting protein isoform X2 [Hyperolius riggenbachi]|uniref:capZ-interacting protein isoform X2 n=1 Tax=Hyperolius riggenbachi TaxID=752182 RepID=UPI0035A33977
MEGKPADSGSAEEAPAPSVAKLAGLFGDKLNAPKKEAPAVPPNKPTRRRPPCSLPLPKPEATNNGSEKVSPPHAQVPKIKVKSSPLIEKLQANLAFPPVPLLPGVSPKSPGLKIMASPFNSPPSTPSSPGVQNRSSEPEETPASFEQPPEGAPLASYTKVRTRGSIKRRPPSRKFRRSQGDMDFDVDQINTLPKENGDNAEAEDAGSSETKEEPSVKETTQETDTASHDSVDEPSASPTAKTEEEGEAEKQGDEKPPNTAEEQEDKHPKKEEGTLETNGTDAAVPEQDPAAEHTENSCTETGESQEKDDSSDHSKCDGEDKPEK